MKVKNVIEDICAEDDFVSIVQSPIGALAIIATAKGVKAICPVKDFLPQQNNNHHSEKAKDQLEQYFEGRLQKFDIEVDFKGHTDFSIKVWNELMKIPFGKTISYAQLAEKLSNPLCIRAAATANGRNPIPIIVPCHRVIGSDGSLTGFALGLDNKRKLLSLENPAKYALVQTSLF